MFCVHQRPGENASAFRSLHGRRRPRLLDTLELADRFQALLDQGEVKRRSELAERFGISRERVTQVLALKQLEPSIRAHAERDHRVSERALRPLLGLAHAAQVRAAPRTVPGWRAAHR